MNDKITQPDTPNWTQRRISKTRNSLLRAALPAFTEAGTDPATIEMRTQRADLDRRTFYRTFKPKPVDGVMIRRLAYTVAALIREFLSFAMIIIEPQAVRESQESMRGAFLSGMVGFMKRP